MSFNSPSQDDVLERVSLSSITHPWCFNLHTLIAVFGWDQENANAQTSWGGSKTTNNEFFPLCVMTDEQAKIKRINEYTYVSGLSNYLRIWRNSIDSRAIRRWIRLIPVTDAHEPEKKSAASHDPGTQHSVDWSHWTSTAKQRRSNPGNQTGPCCGLVVPYFSQVGPSSLHAEALREHCGAQLPWRDYVALLRAANARPRPRLVDMDAMTAIRYFCAI
jgi:hypothetical protein